MNAVITPRKTNVSPKIITYTHSQWWSSPDVTTRQIPHRPSSTRWTKNNMSYEPYW